MRVVCSVIALVLIMLAVVPGAANVPYACDSTPALSSLDVCHASGGSMSLDLPCLLVVPTSSATPQMTGAAPVANVSPYPILFVLHDERPPEFLL